MTKKHFNQRALRILGIIICAGLTSANISTTAIWIFSLSALGILINFIHIEKEMQKNGFYDKEYMENFFQALRNNNDIKIVDLIINEINYFNWYTPRLITHYKDRLKLKFAYRDNVIHYELSEESLVQLQKIITIDTERKLFPILYSLFLGLFDTHEKIVKTYIQVIRQHPTLVDVIKYLTVIISSAYSISNSKSKELIDAFVSEANEQIKDITLETEKVHFKDLCQAFLKTIGEDIISYWIFEGEHDINDLETVLIQSPSCDFPMDDILLDWGYKDYSGKERLTYEKFTRLKLSQKFKCIEII